jgi:hypothetical protein
MRSAVTLFLGERRKYPAGNGFPIYAVLGALVR